MDNERWVNERLSSLESKTEWQPNTGKAYERLLEKQETESAARRTNYRWIWLTAAAAIVGLLAMVHLPIRAEADMRTADARFDFFSLEHLRVLHYQFAKWLSSNHSLAAESPASMRVGAKAPNFQLADTGGKPIVLSDFRGKVVLLDFWATWCHGCQVEIPWFVEFQQTYGSRGFSVLGVSFDEGGWSSVKPFVEKRKINYPVMIGNNRVASVYDGVLSLPTTLLIDKTGRVAYVHIGLGNKDDFRTQIEMLLNK